MNGNLALGQVFVLFLFPIKLEVFLSYRVFLRVHAFFLPFFSSFV